MKKTKRRLALVGIAVAIAIALVVALLPGPVPVSAVRVERGPFTETIEEEGRTALREPFTVTAPIDGHLRRVRWEVGDEIASGDPLFEIEPGPAPALDPRTLERARAEADAAESRLRAAEADLEANAATLEFAEREYERARVLHEQNAVSTSHLESAQDRRDRARGELRVATAAVETSGHELRNARAVLEIAQGQRQEDETAVLSVHSPVGGTVLARHRWDEGPVRSAEPVLGIGDVALVEARIDVLSMDAVRLREGMEVVLIRWGGGRELRGRVRRVEPAGFEKISALGVEEQRVHVWVSIESPREEWAPLGSGYRVEARFVLWEEEEVLQVPVSALFRHRDDWAVYVARDGRARLQPVAAGRRSGLWAQILSGIEAGDIVITHPGDRVEEGVRVDPEIRPY